MNNAQILQTAEPISAPAQDQSKSSNRIRLVDEDVSTRGLSAGRSPASRRLVDDSGDGEEVLRVVGMAQLTATHCRRFRKRVRAALNGHTVIEIDLSRTTSMDCAGLGSLIAIRNLTLDRNGVVRLLNPTSRVQQVLDLTRAGQIFEIVKTLI
ncbi:MAG TPA: STAS domain-containing protein [Candidatus Limnocylindrales bacterium]|nr:STAS domain-containing protein [Candidatus Limnocylindrales bacterium]